MRVEIGTIGCGIIAGVRIRCGRRDPMKTGGWKLRSLAKYVKVFLGAEGPPPQKKIPTGEIQTGWGWGTENPCQFERLWGGIGLPFPLRRNQSGKKDQFYPRR